MGLRGGYRGVGIVHRMVLGPSGWSRRLDAVLGVPVDRLGIEDLDALVSSGVREADDLDFKLGLYGNSDADRVELAADVAALANHRGGLILLGVEEADGAATRLPAVAVSDDEERRMTQIIAGLVAPYVDVQIRRIDDPSAADRGFFVLVVPPSPGRPHAVMRDKKLQYPRRDGTTRRWLVEAEVADLYRDRFRQADDVTDRIGRIIDETLAGLDPEPHYPRVVVGLVPTASSEVPNNAARLREIKDWAGQFSAGEIEGFWAGTDVAARVGLRRARLFDNYSAEPPKWSYTELHTDGAAAATCPIILLNSAAQPTDVMLPWVLIRATARCLNIAVCHAVDHAGAYGDILVEARLIGPMPLRLGRLEFGTVVTPFTPAVPLPLTSRHTVLTDALVVGACQEILAVTCLLLTDIVQAMGLPEITELREDGAIVSPEPWLRDWAEGAGVTVV